MKWVGLALRLAVARHLGDRLDKPAPRWAIWSSAPSRAARAMPRPRCLLSTNKQVIRIGRSSHSERCPYGRCICVGTNAAGP
jgi:hypothetical protein